MPESLPIVPEEEITNMDAIFDRLPRIISEVEYDRMIASLPKDNFPMEEYGQSLLLEQTEGRQTIMDVEIIEIDSETNAEKAITSKNERKKAKKVSELERKAQLVLMKVLEETCKGDYTVRVSGDELTTKAKSKHRKDRVTNTGALNKALISAVGEVMNERGDVFMRGYKQHKRVLEYWMQGPNGEGSTDCIEKDYENIKARNIKLRKDYLMIKEENETLKKKLEMVQKMQDEKDQKHRKMEEKNRFLRNQLRKCKSLLHSIGLYP